MATKPRAVLPGTVTLSTRRCTQRQFLLRPDGVCNEAVLYCFAVAAERYEMEVHGVNVMSNHVQYVVTDRYGRRPAFERYFHALVARCMNVVRGRRENFWSSDGPSAVELHGSETVLEKLVYVLTDPVRQHLVERVHAWPGVSSYRYQLGGGTMRAKRPRVFFDAEGDMPEVAELRLVRPPGFEGWATTNGATCSRRGWAPSRRRWRRRGRAMGRVWRVGRPCCGVRPSGAQARRPSGGTFGPG